MVITNKGSCTATVTVEGKTMESDMEKKQLRLKDNRHPAGACIIQVRVLPVQQHDTGTPTRAGNT